MNMPANLLTVFSMKYSDDEDEDYSDRERSISGYREDLDRSFSKRDRSHRLEKPPRDRNDERFVLGFFFLVFLEKENFLEGMIERKDEGMIRTVIGTGSAIKDCMPIITAEGDMTNPMIIMIHGRL